MSMALRLQKVRGEFRQVEDSFSIVVQRRAHARLCSLFFSPCIPVLLHALTKKVANPKAVQHIFSRPAPKPIVPKSVEPSEWTLTDVHPREIARQITVLMADLFQKLQVKEFLGQAWTKKDKELLAPNLLNMIRFSNKVRVLAPCLLLHFESVSGLFINIYLNYRRVADFHVHRFSDPQIFGSQGANAHHRVFYSSRQGAQGAQEFRRREERSRRFQQLGYLSTETHVGECEIETNETVRRAKVAHVRRQERQSVPRGSHVRDGRAYSFHGYDCALLWWPNSLVSFVVFSSCF